MGNPIPTQTRTIDAYASFNSNIANRLTRIVTDGQDCLLLPSPIEIEKVSNTIIKATAGKCVKDDVLIEIIDHSIDLTDGDNYIDSTAVIWNEIGYYYAVLEYKYEKLQPAPTASILIILPSERNSLYDPDKHLFLACLEVSAPGSVHQVDKIWSYDPDLISVRRNVIGVGEGAASFIDATSDYDAKPDDQNIRVTGDTTITLPLASVSTKEIRIIKADTAPTITTVVAQGANTIDSNASIQITEIWSEVTVLPDSVNNVWIEV